MNFRPVTLFLFLGLFVTSANDAGACGDEHSRNAAQTQQAVSKKSCCAKEEAQTSCSNDSGQRHSDSNCPCDHDNGGCHCPGCGLMCHSGAASALETPLNFAASLFNDSVQKMAFYFAEHLPEAVYLPIWQPPKISA
ncbi:MAG: hypothetical protein KA165_17060 [Saprospiraceae bacterium]|jgi:hypothetical protein|nr:hypothetical protein [Saprospiraceae bacterium]